MPSRIGLCLLLFVLSAPSMAAAQSDLATLRADWKSCKQKMAEQFKALDAGDTTPGLADDYRDLVDQANRLIKSMRKQAVVELGEKPGDGQIIRTMLGIMVHDAQEGRDGEVFKAGQALIDARINPKYFEQAASIERLELHQKQVFEDLVVRHKEAVADDLPRVKLKTTAGDIVLELFENEAPNTVRNFVSLAESGYYENKLFHRVIEGFMAQGGGFENEAIGSGGPGYEIECECRAPDARRNFGGTISMAHAGRDTGGSQFFLNFKHNKPLDQVHTVFGRVIEGTEVLDKIKRTYTNSNGMERRFDQVKPDKIVSAEVLRKRDHSYRVRKKGEPELPEEPVKEEKEPEVEETKEEPEAEKEEEPQAADEPEMKEEPQLEDKPETEPEPASDSKKEMDPEPSDSDSDKPMEPKAEPAAETPADPEPETPVESETETPVEPEAEPDSADDES